jgi:hypothetical protein
MVWEALDRRATPDHLGLIPDMLCDQDPLPAREQLNRGYAHGGGWRPMKKFILRSDDSLCYPGDPSLRPLFKTMMRDELVLVYDHAWVAIVQPDRSFEVCRMD